MPLFCLNQNNSSNSHFLLYLKETQSFLISEDSKSLKVAKMLSLLLGKNNLFHKQLNNFCLLSKTPYSTSNDHMLFLQKDFLNVSVSLVFHRINNRGARKKMILSKALRSCREKSYSTSNLTTFAF